MKRAYTRIKKDHFETSLRIPQNVYIEDIFKDKNTTNFGDMDNSYIVMLSGDGLPDSCNVGGDNKTKEVKMQMIQAVYHYCEKIKAY